MTFYEFFAGGGMARLGLGKSWRCLFANDFDERKAGTYRNNFGPCQALHVQDIREFTPSDLPGQADLAWASFPCQDLSLAGNGKGLSGMRSGTFWTFWRLMEGLMAEARAPRTIVLENVRGAISSHQGRDFASICEALTNGGYCYAPLVVDAQLFLPQSRPRLFVVAFTPAALESLEGVQNAPTNLWHPATFGRAYDRLSMRAREAWVWLSPTAPTARTLRLSDLIEDHPVGVKWHTAQETERLLALMTPLNREKVRQAQESPGKRVGAVYKRTRREADGERRQRAEVRFDEVAGCLRTPAGGSSRQIIVVVEGGSVRSRLLSPREIARLMGLPESYRLPERYNDAYHLVGDGVAVPVVSWLARSVIEPSLLATKVEVAA